MPEEIEILGTQLALINKYFPLEELYQVCKDLQEDNAIMILQKNEIKQLEQEIEQGKIKVGTDEYNKRILSILENPSAFH